MSTDVCSPPPEAREGAPLVSVLTPHYGQLEALARCLESLQRQTFKGPVEFIVADNGTPGGLGDLPARFPDVRFVIVEERGAAPARNRAMAEARGDIFAFIDADCVADEGWLEAGVAGLDGADLVGGDVRVTCADETAPTPVECFERVFAFRQRDYIERKQFSVTANLFVRRDAAFAIGPFRNGLSEDMDWCHRAGALGFRLVFNTIAIVEHPARRTWNELSVKWDRLIRERWNGMTGDGRAVRVRWLLLSLLTAISAIPHVARILVSRHLRGSRERFAAAAVLIRIRAWRAHRMVSVLLTGPERLR